jgi:hypothetical protein
MHVVLLSYVALGSKVPGVNLRRWLSRPLSITFMGSLHPMLGTVVGIMPQLSTLEATIMLIWGGVSHWFT